MDTIRGVGCRPECLFAYCRDGILDPAECCATVRVASVKWIHTNKTRLELPEEIAG